MQRLEAALTARADFCSRMGLDRNPREFIGANNPPPGDPLAADLLFIDRRIVADAGAYLAFRFGGLEKLLGHQRKNKRAMRFRQTLEYCLDGLVTQDSLAAIIGLCRDTIGEDQSRVKAWVEIDDEFAQNIEHVRQAVIGHVSVNLERFEACLEDLHARDPDLRRMEKQHRAHTVAAKRALAAAAALDAKGEAKKRKAAQADADRAARRIAATLAIEAVAVLNRIMRAEAKGLRRTESDYHSPDPEKVDYGIRECFRHELAFSAEPYLSRSDDPMVGPTALGARVYLELIVLGKIEPEDGRKRAA